MVAFNMQVHLLCDLDCLQTFSNVTNSFLLFKIITICYIIGLIILIKYVKQGHGKSLQIMNGLFRSNGGCGYVKKPDLLMKRGPNDEVFDPKLPLPVKKTLRVSYYDIW